MHATLSFNGLLAGYPELFDDLKVPDSVSKETVCNQLLFDTLELEVLYADGPTMRRALGFYSETMLPSWTRYAAALGMNYDALASDDRTRTTDHAGTSGGTVNPFQIPSPRFFCCFINMDIVLFRAIIFHHLIQK